MLLAIGLQVGLIRYLASLIEFHYGTLILGNFADWIGVGKTIASQAFAPADSFARFRAKARHFLHQYRDHVAIHKLRTDRQLTGLDLAELERILVEGGIGSYDDRAAAKEASATFLAGRTLVANQLEFMAMLIDHLTEQSVLDPGHLYTDLSPSADALFATLEQVRQRAIR